MATRDGVVLKVKKNENDKKSRINSDSMQKITCKWHWLYMTSFQRCMSRGCIKFGADAVAHVNA